MTVGILAVAYLSVTLILGENGFLRYVKLKSKKTELQAKIKNIEKQNQEIREQIEKLKKDPNTIEELARGQGLTKDKDEIIFNFKSDEEQRNR